MKSLCKKFLTILVSVFLLTSVAPAAMASEYTYPVSGGAELVFDPLTGTITDVKDANNLVSVEVPSSIYNIPVKTIGKYAFSDCKNLVQITIPNSVTSIGDHAFSSCKSLAIINIPGSVTSIGGYAFLSCSKLENITIPGSVTELSGVKMFAGCTSLRNVTLSEGIETVDISIFESSISGEQYSVKITDLTFPNSVKTILRSNWKGMWSTLAELENITFGKGLQLIADDSFNSMRALKSVTFTGNAPVIGSDVFDTESNPIIHYPQNATGWSTPVWNGYITQPYAVEGTSATFQDVVRDAFYFDPVYWAVKNNITMGTTTTTFSPNQICTKSQIITFLWRASGSPEPKTANQYTDVSSNDFYYKAALWASEVGLESGLKFNGDELCTREQTVIYLWILAGMPYDIQLDKKFTDVPPLSELSYAVNWAYDNNITLGTSETAFSPDATCTRGQIVTFLYRAMT